MAELEEVVDDGVVASVHRPATTALATVVLAHGAGGNRDAAILRAYADEFVSRGVAVARIDLPYRQRRPKGPPSPSTAAADRAGIAAACALFGSLSDGPLIVGGHSYGGRQASMLIADDASLAAGLFLSSYPLHPPGKPDRLRTEHLPSITVPTLVIHGSSDPFASSDELREATKLIDAQSQIVTVKAPHSLNPARTNVAQLAVDAALDLLIGM
ncbi:hypothetical protein GOEFS_052_00430 [Gordonia effusa NBRC 100432]|uniref:KANL3/Tex30 alpha/beta hydrolase-like domain-containing protein n=1 Tax=Gordonia effusa NBRC 100432 TaxID=1077974 RepID=H0QZW9_9ACTN|nr:alpha/beta fold hydrolase [Gordonia effusa]GAB18370.1 hypothetical protein GOEFS_052_00430 [Gordonia effusa NBRC 100432]